MSQLVSGLRLKHRSINILGVHPEYRHCTRLAQNTPRMIELEMWVSDGARTYEQQKTYRLRYETGKGPLAARPDYVGRDGRRGSAHQIQVPLKYRRGKLDNRAPFAWAIDNSMRTYPRHWDEMRETLAKFGLVANLWHKNEFWHYVIDLDWTPQVLSGHGSAGPVTKGLQRKFRRSAHRHGLVTAAKDLKIDGQHGPATSAIVAMWQKELGYTGPWVNGDWTRENHDRFMERRERAEAAKNVAKRKRLQERAAGTSEVRTRAAQADRQMLTNIHDAIEKHFGQD